MSKRRFNAEERVALCDYLLKNYEYLGEGRIRRVGGKKCVKGYSHRYLHVTIKLNGKRFDPCFHQVVWILCHGQFPKGEIDHIDGDRMNNRIENLRDVSSWQNMWNKLLPWRPNMETNVPGVVKEKRDGVYKTRLFGRLIYSADKYKLFHDAALCGKTYNYDD